MTSTTILQHEPEVLAARNLRTIISRGLPPGWATLTEANEMLIDAAIETATEFAERAFLVCLGTTPTKADAAVTSVILEMMAQANAAADFLGATPEQRHRLEVGRAVLFDMRLAELQATAVLPWGEA